MASPSGGAPSHSRTSLPSPFRNPTAARQRPDLVQLSAADCSVAAADDDVVPSSSSVALTSVLPATDAAARSASASAEQFPSVHEQQQQQRAPSPPPPLLEPVFALLTNNTTDTTVHPHIHYIFSDDDASVPTDDAARHHPDDDDDDDYEDDDRDARYRSLVVDLEPTPARDAWSVSSASSLGTAFAVSAAALAKQQPDGGGGGGGASSSATLMLCVEGVSRDPVDLRSSSEAAIGSGASLRGREDVEALADDFRRRMRVLKKIVGEGEKRRAVVLRQHQDAAAAAEAEAEQYADGSYLSNEIHDPGTLRSGAASQSQDAPGSS